MEGKRNGETDYFALRGDEHELSRVSTEGIRFGLQIVFVTPILEFLCLAELLFRSDFIK